MRSIVFAFAMLLANDVFACRNVVQHKVLTSEEAFKQAELVVSGTLVHHKRLANPSQFTHVYRLKISKIWKGKNPDSVVEFSIEHHTCAQYRQEFAVNDPASSPPVYFYFGSKQQDGMRIPIRIVGAEFEDKKAIETEAAFLTKKQ